MSVLESVVSVPVRPLRRRFDLGFAPGIAELGRGETELHVARRAVLVLVPHGPGLQHGIAFLGGRLELAADAGVGWVRACRHGGGGMGEQPDGGGNHQEEHDTAASRHTKGLLLSFSCVRALGKSAAEVSHGLAGSVNNYHGICGADVREAYLVGAPCHPAKWPFCLARRTKSTLASRAAVFRRGATGGDMKDLFSIAGKTALVTGGSRGIGFMIARGYVAAGAKVYISSRKQDACDRAAATLSTRARASDRRRRLDRGGRARARRRDRRAASPRSHILVNNAGANWGAPLAEYPDAAWDKVLAVNVKGVFHLTRALLPLLERAASAEDPARVINIGSIDGLRVPLLETYAYSASKAAVHHLTHVLAQQLAPKKITRQRRRAGPVREQDDGGHARALRGRDHRLVPARPDRHARGHAASRSTWRRAPART